MMADYYTQFSAEFELPAEKLGRADAHHDQEGNRSVAKGLSDDLIRRMHETLEREWFHPGRRFVLSFQGQKQIIICRGFVDGAIRFEHKEIQFEILHSPPSKGVELSPEDEPDTVVAEFGFSGDRGPDFRRYTLLTMPTPRIRIER